MPLKQSLKCAKKCITHLNCANIIQKILDIWKKMVVWHTYYNTNYVVIFTKIGQRIMVALHALDVALMRAGVEMRWAVVSTLEDNLMLPTPAPTNERAWGDATSILPLVRSQGKCVSQHLMPKKSDDYLNRLKVLARRLFHFINFIRIYYLLPVYQCSHLGIGLILCLKFRWFLILCSFLTLRTELLSIKLIPIGINYPVRLLIINDRRRPFCECTCLTPRRRGFSCIDLL